jgi:hypothetical protein
VLLWTDRRSLEQRRLDMLWTLYRRLTSSLMALTQRGALQEVTTQALPADEEVAARTAQHLADTWFEGLDLEYHDIALGPLLRYKVGGYNAHLHGLCRHAHKAEALLETYSPDRVVMAEPALLPAGAFLEVLARRSGVKVSALLPRPLRALGRALVNQLFYTIGYQKAEVPLFEVQPQPLSHADKFTESVLFVASMTNYLNPLLPVIQALKAQGKKTLALIPRAAKGWGNYDALQKATTVVFADDLVDKDLAATMANRRQGYRRLFRESRPLLRGRLRLENDLDLWPFAAPGMRAVFEHLLPQTVGYVGLAERAFRRFNPRVVIIARQRRAFENAFIAVARRDTIPTAMLIHGHVSAQPIYHFIDGRFDQIDRIFAWGEAQKTALVAKGAPPERVTITGNPQWDKMSAGLGALPPRETCRTEMATALDLSPDAFWVTFTSQPVSRVFFAGILEAVRALPYTANLIVKVHPGERVADYAISPADQEHCRVVKAVDLHTLLRASDAALTYTSTTNLEALAVGTPLVVVDFACNPDDPNRVDLTAYGVPEVHNVKALRQELVRLRDDPARRKEILIDGRRALADYACGLDGRATERVVSELLYLAQGVAR